jgi:hypothetical protein
MDCGDAVQAQILVAGEPWTRDDAPARLVVAGDDVGLSLGGVCTPSGQVAVVWTVTTPGGTVLPLLPSPDAAAVTFFGANLDDYHVRAHVIDPVCPATALDLAIFAARTLGPQPLATNAASGGANDIRGLATGAGFLWVAAGDGAWRIASSPPRDSWQNVEAQFPAGDTLVSANLASVFYDDSSSSVFYGAASPEGNVTRVLLGQGSLQNVNVSQSAGGNVLARDFSRGSGPLHLATDKGVLEWASGGAFTNLQLGQTSLNAVAEAPGQPLWAGARTLFRLGGASPLTVDVFGGPDDRVRALAVDATAQQVWVGSDGNGLAPVVELTGAVGDVLSTSGPMGRRLPGNRVRAIVLEGRDVWMATDQGAARYKLDAQAIVSYKFSAPGAPLPAAQLDSAALAIDGSGPTRRVFVGTSVGVLVLETPNQ